MDPEIFRMMRKPIDPTDLARTLDVYLGVCTPVDLQDLPVGDPPNEDPAGYFRVASLDLTFASEELAGEAWEFIKADADALKEALDALDILGAAESYWVGDSPWPDKGIIVAVLEDALLRRLARNDALLEAFPFLKVLKGLPMDAGCGRCGRRATAKTAKPVIASASVLNSLKGAIASLDPEKRTQFKQISGLKTVKIMYRHQNKVHTVEL
jgi:hypothetical protein